MLTRPTLCAAHTNAAIVAALALIAVCLRPAAAADASAAPAAAPAAPATSGTASSKNKVLAQVNDEAVTAYQVDEFVFFRDLANVYGTGAKGMAPKDAATAAEEKREALDELIDQMLLLQEAKRVESKDDRFKAEIEFYLKKHMKRLETELGLAKLQKTLGQRNRSIRDYRKDARDRIRKDLFLERKVYDNVHVRPSEILAFYEEHKKDYERTYELRFRQIWFHKGDYDEELQKARNKADEVRQALLKGADFVKEWQQCSYDRDFKKESGGLQSPRQYASVADKNLRALLEKLPEGAVSDVLPYTNGWRLIKVETKPHTEIGSFESVQEDIKRKLDARKRIQARQAYVKQLREKSFVRYFKE